MKNNHREGTCLRDKTTMKLIHAIMVSTSQINDYQSFNVYEHYIAVNIDEVNVCNNDNGNIMLLVNKHQNNTTSNENNQSLN